MPRRPSSLGRLSSGKALFIHLSLISLLSALLYLCFNGALNPSNGVWLEGEGFSYREGAWAGLEDINFSGAAAIMTFRPSSPALKTFEVPRDARYAVWVKYFGNYASTDLSYWRSVYTNSYNYLDYSGAIQPLDLTVQLDALKPVALSQTGSHRYRWKKAGEYALSKGAHTVKIWKAGAATGSVNMDGMLLTEDLSYAPHWLEVLPRQASEYYAPVLMASFPFIVWAYKRRLRTKTTALADGLRETDDDRGAEGGGARWRRLRAWMRGPGPKGSSMLIYSIFLSSVLSVMWIDTDGAFWIWLTQSNGFNLSTIYSSGEALHHRYVYPPPVAVMLIALRPVFALFGAMDGITPSALLLSKLAVIPFVAGTGALLYAIAGSGALLIWALNSFVIFTVAANSMYFGLAFILTLALYFAKKERHLLSALSLGLSLSYMSAAALLVPPFLILSRSLGDCKKSVLMAALAVLPSFLIFLPYSIIDPAHLNSRVMGAGIATWMNMHLGLRVGDVGLTTLLYAAFLAFLWVRKPEFNSTNIASSSAMASLIYLNVGAPYFLLWSVAFQPFIIAWAVEKGEEFFYSLYVTALMAWASFYMNTGGAGDRAGETGFFPNYVFYTWPFDVYSLVKRVYGRADYFPRPELSSLIHSASAGVSLILLLMMARGLAGSVERPVKQRTPDER